MVEKPVIIRKQRNTWTPHTHTHTHNDETAANKSVTKLSPACEEADISHLTAVLI